MLSLEINNEFSPLVLQNKSGSVQCKRCARTIITLWTWKLFRSPLMLYRLVLWMLANHWCIQFLKVWYFLLNQNAEYEKSSTLLHLHSIPHTNWLKEACMLWCLFLTSRHRYCYGFELFETLCVCVCVAVDVIKVDFEPTSKQGGRGPIVLKSSGQSSKVQGHSVLYSQTANN